MFQSPARFKVVYAGRRWGKTELGTASIIRGIAQRPGLYWWVGLSWRSASMKRAWRILCKRLRPIARVREVEHEIKLTNGSQIWMRTAENIESLAGEGVTGVVVDEFTLMCERMWTEYVRATLADRQGWALFIGVPKGNGWGQRLWLRGQNAEQGWASWQLPTSSNPFIPASEIEAARRDLPERMFRQEFLAEVLADGGGVFRRVTESATATEQSAAIPDHDYIMGADWGKTNDFTVLSVIDVTTGEQVAMDRFNQIDYAVQRQRLMALAERFNVRSVIAERNSMGEPIIEQLQRDGVPVQAFLTTNASKSAIIEGLALAFERGALRVLPNETQTAELLAFESERMPSGMLRYGAPEGLHDDCVMSLALAWSGASEPQFRITRL